MTAELAYCPVCGGAAESDGNRITCAQCGLVFRVRVFTKRKKAELGFYERLKRIEKTIGKLPREAPSEPDPGLEAAIEFDAEED